MSDAGGQHGGAAAKPGTRIGPYELIDMLGEGGMGVVYRARHVTLEKTVAIKLLSNARAQSADVVTRFIREGKAAAKIRHPHVVDVVDVGVHEGMFYLVMELLDGQTLASYMKQHGRLSAAAVAEIMMPVLSAVSAAHTAGIVHRDLKPENIFLCNTPSGAPHPKVLDFGIAREVTVSDDMRLTDSKSMVGTPMYMSPEQITDARRVTALTDQYSLGVVLFEMVTGDQPFARESLFAVLNAVATDPVPSVRSVEPSVPEAFERMIERAMSRNPEDRFPSLRECGVALLEFASPRTLVLWGDEFRGSTSDVPPVASTSDAPSPPNVTPNVTPRVVTREGGLEHAATDVASRSTLRRSALELPIRSGPGASVSPPPSRSLRMWLGAGSVLVVASIAGIGSRFIGSTDRSPPSPVRAASAAAPATNESNRAPPTITRAAPVPLDLASPPTAPPAPVQQAPTAPSPARPEPSASAAAARPPAATIANARRLPSGSAAARALPAASHPPAATAATTPVQPTQPAATAPAATVPAATTSTGRTGNNNAPIVE